MDERTRFLNTVKACASAVTGIIAFAAYMLGLSPDFASQYFLDLVTSFICSGASIFYTVKNRAEPPA